MEATFLRETLRKGRYCLHDSDEVLKDRASARNRLKWLRSSTDQMSTKSENFWSFGNVKCQHLISHNHAWQGKRSPCSSNQGMHDPISYTREQCKSSQRYLAQGAFKGVAEGGIDTLEAIRFLVLWLHALGGETSHRQCDLVKTAAPPQPCRCNWLVLGIREPLLPIHNTYIYIRLMEMINP